MIFSKNAEPAIQRPSIVRSRGLIRKVAAWLLFLCLPASIALAATQYLYDDLGRLVLAVNSDGSAIVYEHDQNGNLISVIQTGTTGPIIGTFSPAYGRAGTAVTISGTGFGATPAENSVTIGGQAAVVTTASTTTLTTSIPQGAHTGPITVTVNGVAATSSDNIVVLWPAITSFTPAMVAPGAAVTLTGTNLNLVPGSTSVSVGATAATISSITNNQIVFVAPNSGAGLVTVSTSYGQASSASALTIVPNSIGAANVVSTGALQANGSAQSVTVNQQNKYGLLLFDGVAGQFFTVQVDSLSTTPSGNSVSYQVFSPSGASLTNGAVSSTAVSVHLPALPATGTYIVAFGSGSSTFAQVAARLELNPTLSADGTSLSASTLGARQSKRFVFNATAGDDFGLALTALSLTPSSPTYIYFEVFQPNGTNVASFYCYTTTAPGCVASLPNVAQTGAYTVKVTSQGAQTMSFNLTLSQDISGTLTAGTPATATLSVPGKQALYTFSATAGQTVALYMGSISTTPSGKTVYMYVYGPSGTQVGQASSATMATLNLTNLAAGTYSVLVVPNDAATGSVQATLANGLTGTLPADGTTQSFSSSVPRQNGYFTFSANAGANLGIAMTGLALTPSSPTYVYFEVLQPNTSVISSFYCYTTSSPGCSASLTNLPATGTYTVRVTPQGAQTMSFNLTLSQDVTGTLTAGTPATATLSVPGKQALYTFTATAGQTVALYMGSISTTPAGKTVWMYAINPSGTQIGSVGNASQGTLNLTNLAAGTYSVLIVPSDAASGSVQVTLANGLTGTLPTDGTSQSLSTTVPAQNAYFTFSATAGANLGIAFTGLSLSPGSPNYVKVEVQQPNGNWLVNGWCYTTNAPGCSWSLLNVAQTGTYTVRVTPQGPQTMSFNLTLSQDVTGTLTAGTPATATLSVPGNQALYTFTATAGQTVALYMGSISTTPAGKTVWMYAINPSGTQIGSVGNASQGTLNLTNLAAGTYSVLIVPNDAATGSVQVTLANGLTATLPTDGTSQSFSSTVPAQNAYFTFSANAGDDLSLVVAGLSLAPSSPNYVKVEVQQPNGNYLVNGWCYMTSTPGCAWSLPNVGQTGTYTFRLLPQGSQTMSFNVALSQDVTGALTTGTPYSVSLAANQNAMLTFVATAGQSASLTMSSILTTPSGKSVTTSVFNPSGTQVASTTGTTLNLTNLVAGTYSVLIAPADGAAASLQVLRQ